MRGCWPHECSTICCRCPGFPDLPFVGKMTQSKPLPTFESRVGEDGTIEVLV